MNIIYIVWSYIYEYMCLYFMRLSVFFFFFLPLAITFLGFPGGSDGKECTCNDLGLIPGLGRFPWRRAWPLTPVFLPGESPWTEEPGGLQTMALQRAGHD